jgi:hypothetical protein
VSGADALKAALNSAGNAQPGKRTRAPAVHGKELEDRLVDEAFRLLSVPVKAWIRSRVRAGSGLVETVARLSSMLEAGQSIADAAGGIAKAIQDVTRASRKR